MMVGTASSATKKKTPRFEIKYPITPIATAATTLPGGVEGLVSSLAQVEEFVPNDSE
jgi:hypothetical protein